MTVVSFSLDAAQKSAYSLWKASDGAPLLVYDPEGGGEVTSARQLFGNYSFGGVTAHLADYHATALRKPWEHGFAAMAVLDHNKDGKLFGPELDALRLWFDSDRDAEVDEGELRSLSEERVTALYFEQPKPVPGTRDLVLDIGYERVVDGQVITGKTIDWYAQTFSSKQEAAQALDAIFRNVETGSHLQVQRAAVTGPEWAANPKEFIPRVASDHRSDLSGYWLWWVNDENGHLHPGVFAFSQEKGSVKGFSVAEMQLEDISQKLKSAVRILPAEGSVSRNENAELELNLEITAAYSGGTAKSTAVLSQDGETLRGRTTQMFSIQGRRAEKHSASVNYEWTARKFVERSTPNDSDGKEDRTS